jgi:CheY-like chemotaxis protein
MQLTEETSTWRVLIVDDEPDNLKLAADLLEYVGATVSAAGGGQEALELADQFRPNMILLDLAMPELDGWEVHRRLRARKEFDHTPIVALTALVMASDAEKVRNAGFDAYITKPFRVKTLILELVTCVRAFTLAKTINRPTSAVQGNNHE